jgi:hypothetical protein
VDLARAKRLIPDAVADATRLPVAEVSIPADAAGEAWQPKLEITAGNLVFQVEYRSRSTSESVGAALALIRSSPSHGAQGPQVPLLVVPHMGDVGRHMCERAEVAWVDLSGNASIQVPGIHVHVLGQPNRYPPRGRPRDLFAPKASRVARALLRHPDRGWTHHELVEATHLSKGYLSKVLSRFREAALLETRGDDRLWVRDPGDILEAWRASYDFSAHNTLRGFVPERDPGAVVRRLTQELGAHGIEPAVTGLGAAWHYARFAGHRLSTLFVPNMPPDPVLSQMGFQPGPTGANAWLVEPFDAWVFLDTVSVEGVTFVSPLQAYLDLKGHPERSDEAADALRPLVLRVDDEAGQAHHGIGLRPGVG